MKKEKLRKFEIELYLETDKKVVVESFNSVLSFIKYCLYGKDKIKDLVVWDKKETTIEPSSKGEQCQEKK